MSGDHPSKAMFARKNKTYTVKAEGINYPKELGQGEYHSYINFKVVERKETKHTSDEGDKSPAKNSIIQDINLYIPESVALSQTASWNAQQSFGLSMTDALGSDNKLENLGAGIVNMAGNFAGGGASGEMAIQSKMGLASNASKMQLFEGIEFRQFQFQYKFLAASPDEAQNINQIIRTFRKHMLPEIKGAFYTVPDLFDIEYRVLGNGPKPDSALHKITECALTACEVNYGADGAFGVFWDGQPTNIAMNLTFLEMKQVTRDMIDEGY